MQVCTSLQTDNHANTPPLSFFTGRMPFLPPNQQRQSTEGSHSPAYTTVHKNFLPRTIRDWNNCSADPTENSLLNSFKESLAQHSQQHEHIGVILHRKFVNYQDKTRCVFTVILIPESNSLPVSLHYSTISALDASLKHHTLTQEMLTNDNQQHTFQQQLGE